MKSLSWAVLGLLMAVASFAADNNIKMVTYFPVPYAAYGDLGVTGTCDVGLMGQCKLDAGKNLTVAKGASDSRALNTGSIIVRKGTLGLNPASSLATGTSITAGSAIGTGILEFSHDLAVTSINSSRLAKARAMNEAQMNSLNMYGNVFPKCDESGNKISWKKLTIGNKSGVFLVCGAGEEVEETCEQNPNQKKCCTGCETWNGSRCRAPLCRVGTQLNPETCTCEPTFELEPPDEEEEEQKGTWQRDVTFVRGSRSCRNCKVTYQESPVYEDAFFAGRSCTPLGDVRYVVLNSYSCPTSGPGCDNLNWTVADMHKYVCK